MSNPISVVIVTFQSRHTIASTLAALAPAREKELIECVVVDNDSQDGTAEFVRECFPWVHVMKNEANIGFARACNQGAANGANPYVLFLNPDAAIECDAIERLLAFMESTPNAGIAGPALRESLGGAQAAGDYPTPGIIIGTAMGRSAGYRSRPIHPGEPAFRTDWVCGAVMLVRRALLRKIGSFDPRFFLYFEETDLCRRASTTGWEIWAVGEAEANHAAASSSLHLARPMFQQCIAKHYFESRYYYLIKHFGWLAASATELIEFALLLTREMLRRLLGRPPNTDVRARLDTQLLRLPRRHATE